MKKEENLNDSIDERYKKKCIYFDEVKKLKIKKKKEKCLDVVITNDDEEKNKNFGFKNNKENSRNKSKDSREKSFDIISRNAIKRGKTMNLSSKIIKFNELNKNKEIQRKGSNKVVDIIKKYQINKEREINYKLQSLKTSLDAAKINLKKKNNNINKLKLRNSYQIRSISTFASNKNNSFRKFLKLNAENTNEKNNSVNEIVMNLPEHDSTFNIKLLYEKNILYHKVYNDNIYENNTLNKISTEIINSLNTLYCKNKIFFRKLFYINPSIQMQFNSETAFLFNVHNLYHNIRHKIQKNGYIKPKNDDYKIHEKLYSYNFKGILNPSKKCQFLGTNKTLHSYMLGNSFYSLFNNKIIFKKMPIFNIFEMQKDGFEISPYVHFNSLITVDRFNFNKIPKNFKDVVAIIDNNDNDLLRMTAGLGVNVISKLFSFEIIYTPYVKKNLTDIHSKFTVKFGID
jgi:hypothetical protein